MRGARAEWNKSSENSVNKAFFKKESFTKETNVLNKEWEILSIVGSAHVPENHERA